MAQHVMVGTVINNHPDVLSEVGVCLPDDMHMTNQCTFCENRSRDFYVFRHVNDQKQILDTAANGPEAPVAKLR